MPESLNQIVIIPIGDLDFTERDLLDIKNLLEEVFKRSVRLEEKIAVANNYYNQFRDQWLARGIIELLPERAELILGIIDCDLYAPRLNFIFGEAHPHRRKAIISLARLRPEFWKDRSDPTKFKNRVVKEAVHEIGHLLGLRHCPDCKCVMYFSNSIYDTDRKNYNFCKNCSAKLKERKII